MGMKSCQTDGVLSVDPADKLTSSYNDAYAATTSTQIKGAVARNVFVIEPYVRYHLWNPDIIGAPDNVI